MHVLRIFCYRAKGVGVPGYEICYKNQISLIDLLLKLVLTRFRVNIIINNDKVTYKKKSTKSCTILFLISIQLVDDDEEKNLL